MARRDQLQMELVDFLGSNNVYFQPPESIKLRYPCIIYQLNSGDTKFANNMPYNFEKRYEITLIDKDPDSELVRELAYRFPKIVFNRHFVYDNLNHDIFTLYY